MNCIAIVILASFLIYAGAYSINSGIRPKFARKVSFSQITASSSAPWKVEEDTAELEWGSSVDIKRVEDEKARLENEAKIKEAQSRHQKLLNEILATKAATVQKKSENTEKTTPVSPSLVAKPPSSATAAVAATNAMSSGTSGFDIGLLLAFPIIVGTLGYFFLFPIIGPQIASQLPPVPPM